MKNKEIWIVWLLFIIGVVGRNFIEINGQLGSIFNVIFWISQLGFLSLMFQSGNTKLKSIIPLFFLLGLVVVGFVFKIMHWPMANLMLIAGAICLLVFYGFHFYKKEQKTEFDYIKLIWIVAFSSTIFCIVFRVDILNLVKIIFA